MIKIKLQKTIYYLVVGVVAILSLGLISTLIASILPNVIGKQTAVTLTALSPIVGGFISAYFIKEKGFIYGAIVGTIIQGLSWIYIAIALTIVTPGSLDSELLKQNIENHLFFPIYILLAAFGGWLGEKYSRKN